MTKFVWVFGPTAVGKDTLITNIAKNPTHPLINRLKLDQPILIQQDALVQRHVERDPLEFKILTDQDKAKTILIKGQGHDIGQRTVLKLQEMLPNEEFIYLYLDAAPEIIKQRRQKRRSPAEPWDDVRDRAVSLESAKALEAQGIKFIWFDNSGEELAELPGPPCL